MATDRAAAQSMGIVATVNNAPISEYDLRGRIEMVIALAGLPRNQQTMQRLAPGIVQTLIEDELKRQEADNLGLEISQSEVDRMRRDFERSRNLPEGSIHEAMKRVGVGAEVVDQQIRADIGWNMSLRRRFRALTQVTDEEIDEEIARMDANKGKPVALLSEIFLPIDNPSKAEEVRRTAERVANELKNGGRFAALATTFSQSATAAVGGDLGWVAISSLPPESQSVISALKPGDYSPPVKTNLGYTIYWYKDQRVSQGATGPAVDPKITLQQLFIPVPENANPGSEAEKMSLAKRLALRADTCDNMSQLPRLVAGGLTSDRNELQLSQLAPRVREVVKDLPDGQVSEPLKVPGAVLLFMICGREQAGSAEQLREQIRNRLIDERLNLAARQYMRDLKRNAFIERK